MAIQNSKDMLKASREQYSSLKNDYLTHLAQEKGTDSKSCTSCFDFFRGSPSIPSQYKTLMVWLTEVTMNSFGDTNIAAAAIMLSLDYAINEATNKPAASAALNFAIRQMANLLQVDTSAILGYEAYQKLQTFCTSNSITIPAPLLELIENSAPTPELIEASVPGVS